MHRGASQLSLVLGYRVRGSQSRANAETHLRTRYVLHLSTSSLSVRLFERRRRSRDVGAASCFVEDARPGMKLVKAMNDGHDASRRGGFINLQNVLVANLLLILQTKSQIKEKKMWRRERASTAPCAALGVMISRLEPSSVRLGDREMFLEFAVATVEAPREVKEWPWSGENCSFFV